MSKMSKALRKILDVTRNQLRIFNKEKDKHPLFYEHVNDFGGIVNRVVKDIAKECKEMVMDKEKAQFKVNAPPYGIVIGFSKHEGNLAVKINYKAKEKTSWEVFGLICRRPEYYEKIKHGDFISIEGWENSNEPPEIKHLYGIYGQDFHEFPKDIPETQQVDYRLHQMVILQTLEISGNFKAVIGRFPMKLGSIPTDVKLYSRDSDWTEEDGNKVLNEQDEGKISNLVDLINLLAADCCEKKDD